MRSSHARGDGVSRTVDWSIFFKVNQTQIASGSQSILVPRLFSLGQEPRNEDARKVFRSCLWREMKNVGEVPLQTESSPANMLRTVGPKLVPFFKTVCIYFILWLPEAENPSALSALVKCLPILCLCGFIWFQSIRSLSFTTVNSYGTKIFLGLVFSCIGDIFIVWEYSHFEHGIVAFALAHLFYVFAFGFKPLKLKLGVALLAFSTFIYFVYFPKLGGFLVPAVAVYMFVITLMTWRALAQLHSGFTEERKYIGLWTNLAACVGALSFATSDFILGLNKFCFAVPWARALIMVGYYGGQLGIALSTLSVGSESELTKKGKQT